MSKPAKTTAYVGTYTRSESHVEGKATGVHRCAYDAATGALTLVETVRTGPNPSFLALGPGGRTLYAVHETTEGPNGEGTVSALRLDSAGRATPLNAQPSGGRAPCHLAVEPEGEFAFVANYGSGTIGVLRLLSSGQLGALTDIVEHGGSGPNRARQEGAHAHMVLPGPGGFVYAADLGADRVFTYRLNRQWGTLHPAAEPWAAPPGSGPRHLAFDPTGRFAYVLAELTPAITALRVDAATGSLAPVHTLALTANGRDKALGGEVQCSADGRFVYASLRGEDAIVTCAADPDSGALEVVGRTPSGGKTPRFFALGPGGRYLLAANQDSDTVVSLALDPATGLPAPQGTSAALPTPVCIVFNEQPVRG
jgi:6-phosphogluconolactonase